MLMDIRDPNSRALGHGIVKLRKIYEDAVGIDY